MMIVLEEDEQTKLKYFSAAMVASKSSAKFTYETWRDFLMRWMETGLGIWWNLLCHTVFHGTSCRVI